MAVRIKKQPLPEVGSAKMMFQCKAVQEGKSVYLEGYANRAVFDRGDELIPPTAWDLTDYKKNPIVFFNHDRNTPIGKAVDVRVTKDGLYVRIKLSNSNAAPMPYIRDLAMEGILKTFSVGYDPMDSEEKMADGRTVIHKAKLLENSVVTLPMNQDSTFVAEEKVLTGKDLKVKDLNEARSKVLKSRKTKGAAMACQFQQAMARAQRGVYGFDKPKALAELAAAASMDAGMVTEIMAGNITPVPEAFLQAFSQVFMCDYDWLTMDAEYEQTLLGEEGGGADAAEAADAAVAAAKAAPAAAKFRDFVVGKVKSLLDDGADGDDAVARAIVEYKTSDAIDITPTKEDYEHFFKTVDDHVPEMKEATVAIPTGSTDVTEFGSPEMTVLKSQLAMLGTMVTLLTDMVKELRGVNSKMSDVFEMKAKDQPPAPVPAPVEVPPPPAPTEADSAKMLADRAKRLDIAEKLVNSFERQLAILKG